MNFKELLEDGSTAFNAFTDRTCLYHNTDMTVILLSICFGNVIRIDDGSQRKIKDQLWTGVEVCFL